MDCLTSAIMGLRYFQPAATHPQEKQHTLTHSSEPAVAQIEEEGRKTLLRLESSCPACPHYHRSALSFQASSWSATLTPFNKTKLITHRTINTW